MALIKLSDALIVDASEIVKAERCGNYTDVWLRTGYSTTGNLKQIWDEHSTLWRAIQECAKP